MQKMVVDPNFAEGVKCVLIEKGTKAIWSHKHILDVKNEEIEKYMAFSKDS